jgi:formylglycine-generating enzyme required for sulfatase activity
MEKYAMKKMFIAEIVLLILLVSSACLYAYSTHLESINRSINGYKALIEKIIMKNQPEKSDYPNAGLDTHPWIALRAIQLFEQNYGTALLTKEQKQEIILGSIEEDYDVDIAANASEYKKLTVDDPLVSGGWITVWKNCNRSANHFMDDYNKGTSVGMSALDWCIKDGTANLATFNKAISMTKDVNNENKLSGWRFLGHFIHLLSDMSVPAHARIDYHPIRDNYEYYLSHDYHDSLGTNVWKLYDELVGNLNGVKPIENASFNGHFVNLSRTTRNYFFSDDTFTQDPIPNYTIIKDGNVDTMKNDFKVIIGHAGLAYYYKKLQINNKDAVEFFDISPEVTKKMFKYLGKQAIQQCAGLIKLFYDQSRTYSTSTKDAPIGTISMRKVPAGTFQRDKTATNTSRVSAFWISEKEITRLQWRAVMGKEADTLTEAKSSSTSEPLQMVNWYHTIAFCNKLSIAKGLTPVYTVHGVNFKSLKYSAIPTYRNADWDATIVNSSANGYRLPTEMEWMWAAMGADTGNPGAINTTGYLKAFAGSTGRNAIGAYAWYLGNNYTNTRPAVGGTKLANELGLFDMSGNVWEWCWDWYGSIPDGSLYDYRGAVSGTYRVHRGGGWNHDKSNCAVAYRFHSNPDYMYNSVGFRVVLPITKELHGLLRSRTSGKI